MLDIRLYMAQRITAILMAPLVVGHIGVMIYAVQGGLTADEILIRTQGSVAWFLFYGTFVTAVSIHAAIGLRAVLHEWLRVKGLLLTVITVLIGLCLFVLGARAVWLVTLS